MQTLTTIETQLISGGTTQAAESNGYGYTFALLGAGIGACIGGYQAYPKATYGIMSALAMPNPFIGGVFISIGWIVEGAICKGAIGGLIGGIAGLGITRATS